MTAPMRILVGCETSGALRRRLIARGHDAWSCDTEPAEDGSNRHIRADIRDVLTWGWDALFVAHPPCTRLCGSGVRWLSDPPPNPPADSTEAEAQAWPDLPRDDRLRVIWRHLDQGAALFSACWNAPIPRIAIENPVMHKHAKARIINFRPHAQSVQPWQFGTDPDGPDNYTKRTCFWLRNLPPLRPTGTLDGTTARKDIHHASPGKDRARLRSRTPPGMAEAMADQWAGWATEPASDRPQAAR